MKWYESLTFASTLLALGLSTPTPAEASEFLLVDVNGSVQIRRAGQSQYQSARGGMRLNMGDLVRTGGGRSSPHPLLRFENHLDDELQH